MEPHIASAFDKDLETINLSVLQMGGQVEAAILDAARALESRDEELAQVVVDGDKAIDAAEEEINNQVVRLLALRQPQAGDLRTAVAVMKNRGRSGTLGRLCQEHGQARCRFWPPAQSLTGPRAPCAVRPDWSARC